MLMGSPKSRSRTLNGSRAVLLITRVPVNRTSIVVVMMNNL